MGDDSIHELCAAYALDALDADDLRAFEAHLATCERCREELASLRDAAAMLAYDIETPPTPEALGRRILSQARAERPNVVPIRRRTLIPAAAAAVAAAAAAIVLGFWATSLSHSLHRERTARGVDSRVIAILSEVGARHFPVKGQNGTLVVTPTHKGVLIVNDLPETHRNQTYEAWVIEGKKAPRPAGLFSGGAGPSIVELKHAVPVGAVVGASLERAGGVKEVTGTMLFLAKASAS